jgi:hypothetical protein
MRDRKEAAQNSRKTQWIVGKGHVPLALNGTSSGDAYTAKMQQSVSAQSLRENKARGTNFNLGNQGVDYISSYKDCHKEVKNER